MKPQQAINTNSLHLHWRGKYDEKQRAHREPWNDLLWQLHHVGKHNGGKKHHKADQQAYAKHARLSMSLKGAAVHLGGDSDSVGGVFRKGNNIMKYF